MLSDQLHFPNNPRGCAADTKGATGQTMENTLVDQEDWQDDDDDQVNDERPSSTLRKDLSPDGQLAEQ